MRKIHEIYKIFEHYLGSPQGDVLLLSTIASVLSSEFAAQGIIQREAVAWIYEDFGDAIQLHTYFSNFTCSGTLNLNDTPSYFLRQLLERKDDYFWVACTGKATRPENMDVLFQLIETGYYAGENLQSLVVIDFEGIVPPDFQGQVFAIPISLRKEYTQEFVATVKEWRECLIEYSLKYFPMIQRILKLCIQKEWKEPEHLWLYASAEIMNTLVEEFDERGLESWYERTKKNIAFAIEKSDSLQDDTEIPELVVDALYEYMQHNMRMQNKAITKDVSSDSENLALYDNEYYYFSEKIFKEACCPILRLVSYRQIKNALIDAGYMCKNGCKRRYLTCKVTIKMGSEHVRVYCCKLRRDKVDRLGDSPLYMVCQEEEKNEKKRITAVYRPNSKRTKRISDRK